MPEITFDEERADSIRHEIEPLLKENWSAVSVSYPTSRLKPDFDLYLLLAEQGAIRIFAARSDGALVGYAVVLVNAHPHRVDDIVGTIDTVFVLPEFRAGGTAGKLFRLIEGRLKTDGVLSLTAVARDKHFADWLRIAAGYEQVETVWERTL